MTLPGGATRIDKIYKDGRPRSVTGTGVVAEYYTYSVETDGRLKTQKRLATDTNARLSESWTDMLGRASKTSRPGFTGQSANEEFKYYDDSTGRLTRTAKTDLATTRYEY